MEREILIKIKMDSNSKTIISSKITNTKIKDSNNHHNILNLVINRIQIKYFHNNINLSTINNFNMNNQTNSKDNINLNKDLNKICLIKNLSLIIQTCSKNQHNHNNLWNNKLKMKDNLLSGAVLLTFLEIGSQTITQQILNISEMLTNS